MRFKTSRSSGEDILADVQRLGFEKAMKSVGLVKGERGGWLRLC